MGRLSKGRHCRVGQEGCNDGQKFSTYGSKRHTAREVSKPCLFFFLSLFFIYFFLGLIKLGHELYQFLNEDFLDSEPNTSAKRLNEIN